MKKIISLTLFITFYSLVFPRLTSAKTELSVSPPVTEILLSPNKSVTTTIQLTNLGEDTTYTLSLHRLIPTDNQGHSTIDPKPINQSGLPLIVTLLDGTWDTPTTIYSNQTKSISLKLEAPSLDAPVDLYLAVLARPLVNGLEQSSTTSPGITALLLTTITPLPAIPTDISLKSSSLPPLHDTSKQFQFVPTANNNAEVMLRVKGTLKLTTPLDQTLQETVLEPTLILGKTARELTAFTYQPKFYQLGPHKLTTVLTTEGGRILIESSTIVWFFPIRLTLLLFAVLILLTIFKLRINRLTKASKSA